MTELTPDLAQGPRNGKAPRPVRLMVVDDHPAVRWGLVQLLDAQPDFTVAAVGVDAEGVVGRAQAESIDVVIVDYCLGGHNGLWVCRALKRLARPPHVILFSAFADDHLAACCAVAQADAMLNKGVLGSELCDAVRLVMRGRRLLPKASAALVSMLRRRLAEDEQLLFGMLLAGIPQSEICRLLDISAEQIAAREDTMLRKLEALPGDEPGLAPIWDRGRRVPQRQREWPHAPGSSRRQVEHG
jgi:DNA-binding NarL/FixJ family response regulator